MQYTFTHKQYIEQHTQQEKDTNNTLFGRVWAVPRLCEFYPGICLRTEEKSTGRTKGLCLMSFRNVNCCPFPIKKFSVSHCDPNLLSFLLLSPFFMFLSIVFFMHFINGMHNLEVMSFCMFCLQ